MEAGDVVVCAVRLGPDGISRGIHIGIRREEGVGDGAGFLVPAWEKGQEEKEIRLIFGAGAQLKICFQALSSDGSEWIPKSFAPSANQSFAGQADAAPAGVEWARRGTAWRRHK